MSPIDQAMTQDEYREWRAERAAAARSSAVTGEIVGSPYQRCQGCGNCEYAGGFCSWCSTGDYVLEAHLHMAPKEGRDPCPLGRKHVGPTKHGGLVVGVYHHPPFMYSRRRTGAPDAAGVAEILKTRVASPSELAASEEDPAWRKRKPRGAGSTARSRSSAKRTATPRRRILKARPAR